MIEVKIAEPQGVSVDPQETSGIIKGRDGHSPYIGDNGTWMVWDDDARVWVDTGVEAQGQRLGLTIVDGALCVVYEEG